MSSRTELFPSFPVDLRALWDINGKSLDYAEKAYRAWLEAAGEMQTQAVDFYNDRMAKDSAVIARLGQCKTPAEALNVQAEYASHAFADYVNEGQKIVARLASVAREGMLSGAPGEPGSTGKEPASHKRSAHRASGH